MPTCLHLFPLTRPKVQGAGPRPACSLLYPQYPARGQVHSGCSICAWWLAETDSGAQRATCRCSRAVCGWRVYPRIQGGRESVHVALGALCVWGKGLLILRGVDHSFPFCFPLKISLRMARRGDPRGGRHSVEGGTRYKDSLPWRFCKFLIHALPPLPFSSPFSLVFLLRGDPPDLPQQLPPCPPGPAQREPAANGRAA